MSPTRFVEPPSLEEFTHDLNRLICICADAAVNSFCHRRLKKMEARYKLHVHLHLQPAPATCACTCTCNLHLQPAPAPATCTCTCPAPAPAPALHLQVQAARDGVLTSYFLLLTSYRYKLAALYNVPVEYIVLDATAGSLVLNIRIQVRCPRLAGCICPHRPPQAQCC